MTKLNVFLLCMVIAIVSSGGTFLAMKFGNIGNQESSKDKVVIPDVIPLPESSKSKSSISQEISSVQGFSVKSSSSVNSSQSSGSSLSSASSTNSKSNLFPNIPLTNSSAAVPTGEVQTYKNEFYPSFSLSFQNDDWKVKPTDRPLTQDTKTIEKGNAIATLTHKSGAVLIFDMTPGFPTGFAGPQPCYKEYSVLSNNLIRVLPNSNSNNAAPVWMYSSVPTDFVLSGSPEFASLFDKTNELKPQEPKESVKACGVSLVPFRTKTTLTSLLGGERSSEGWLKISLSGNADAQTILGADTIIKSVKY